jgi:hypothetical protein
MVLNSSNATYVAMPPSQHAYIYILAGRALHYQTEIDRFVGLPQNKDTLRRFELTDQDWSALNLVMSWLHVFCDATLEMSTTKQTTLSHVHAISKALQANLKESLAALPDSTPSCVRSGLVEAHQKLSDYYLKFDESPYYIWASSTF